MPPQNGHSHTKPPPSTAPEFPPPLSHQPPTPTMIHNALSNPPFNWNGIPLRSFRSPTSLSDFSRLEERGEFLTLGHRHRYKLLKTALEKDLIDLCRRHEIETEIEPSLRAAIEHQETREFHQEFMEKLRWGQDSSPLLLRPANFADTESAEAELDEHVLSHEEFHKAMVKFVDQGLKTQDPSIRIYFENYPGPNVAWVVQDFYRRQLLAREAAKIGLEFQQMWEWSERYWNFFEAATKLRGWARKRVDAARLWCSAAVLREYDTNVLDWSLTIESRKRRHQWAVLKRIMKTYELRDEKFPEIQAPAGRSFRRYFGKYGEKQGWYPVDSELEGNNGTGSVVMQQIDGAEKALEAGESLVQAYVWAVDGCSESILRRPRAISPSRTIEEADALLVQMRTDADTLLSRLRSEAGAAPEAAEPITEMAEELPDPTDDSNGDAKVDTQTFMSSLVGRLIRGIFANPEPYEPIADWLTSWRNPRASTDSIFCLCTAIYEMLTEKSLESLGSVAWRPEGLIFTEWLFGIFGFGE